MATLKWSTPAALTSNLLTTQLNSLADGSQSASITYNNSSNVELSALVSISLGSFTPGTDPYFLLRVLAHDGWQSPDPVGGDIYKLAIQTGTGTKYITHPGIRLYPFSLRLYITNHAGAALASSGHTMQLRTYNEASS